MWSLVVAAVDHLGAAVGEDVHAVIIAVQVVDEDAVGAEVVDVLLAHDLAQCHVVDG